MEYRNTKTGAVISVACEIKGGDWEPVKAPKAAKEDAPKDAPKKTSKKSK